LKIDNSSPEGVWQLSTACVLIFWYNKYNMNKKIASLLIFTALFGTVSFVYAEPVVLTNPLPGVDDFKILLTKIAGMIGTLIGALGTIMIIVAAIFYLTSAGSPNRMEVAKKTLIYAIIGIAIGISAKTITDIVLEMLQKPEITP